MRKQEYPIVLDAPNRVNLHLPKSFVCRFASIV